MAKKKGDLILWHQRLGHINQSYLKEMAKKKLVIGLNLDEDDLLKEVGFCQPCVEGKND
jgi:hypothetical protein